MRGRNEVDMNAPDTVFELIMWLLGGLALFIFGMRTMSEGLSNAVGLWLGK